MNRIKQIKSWLTGELQAEIKSFEPASKDASFRRYFRVFFNNEVFHKPIGHPFIIMDAPPGKEDIQPFIDIAEMLQKTGVNVPVLYAINQVSGFILMSDLGSTAYLSQLNSNPASADKLYGDALQALVTMQKGFSTIKHTRTLPLYDEQLLQTEMNLLPDWYIKIHCQQHLTDAEQSVWQQAMNRLILSAQQQPQVFVHRDYHSRNLMLDKSHQLDKSPGIIDIQDAVIGPVTYDLMSLLRDSYIAWPDEKVSDWVELYRQMLLKETLLAVDDKQQFICWFDWMGIQRQLKVVGIFCRLNYRDGKNNYLNDIPQTLAYLYKVCARYTEFDDLLKLLQHLELDRLKT